MNKVIKQLTLIEHLQDCEGFRSILIILTPYFTDMEIEAGRT